MTAQTISREKLAFQTARPQGLRRDVAQLTYGRTLRHETEKLASMISPETETSKVYEFSFGRYDAKSRRIKFTSAPVITVIAQMEDSPPEIPAPILRAIRLVTAGHTDAALDLIYDVVDTLLRRKDLTSLNNVFATIKPKDVTLDLSLALLTASLPARKCVANRSTFLSDLRGSLSEKGEDADLLLAGLD